MTFLCVIMEECNVFMHPFPRNHGEYRGTHLHPVSVKSELSNNLAGTMSK